MLTHSQSFPRIIKSHVILPLKPLMDTTTPVNNLLRPIEILDPALQRPICWGVGTDICHITDHVPEFDELGPI